MDKKIHVLIGAPTSGKTTTLEMLLKKDEFELVPRVTTRPSRKNDINENLSSIPTLIEFPSSIDIGYPQYGHFYGLSTTDINKIIQRGKSPLLICNSFIALEKLREIYGDNVVATYLHRSISRGDISQILDERGVNFSTSDEKERDITHRANRVRDIYNAYAENSHSIDGVLLNTGGLEDLISQLTNLFVDNYSRTRITKADSHLFLIEGATDSGKRELMGYLQKFGGEGVMVATKQTTRKQKVTDGSELISVNEISQEFDLRYSQHSAIYGIDTNSIKVGLSENKYVFLVVNNHDTVGILKNRFPNSSRIYLHRDITDEELKNSLKSESSDEVIADRVRKKADLFASYVSNPRSYDAVLINPEGTPDQLINHCESLMRYMRR